MTTLHKTMSIGIAGWGDPDTGLPYRLRVASDSGVAGTVRGSSSLRDHPEALETVIDVLEGYPEQGTLAFSVFRLDRDPIAMSLRRWLLQARREPIGHLDAALTASGTTLQLDLETDAVMPTAPFNLWLERECVRCTVVGAPTGTVYPLTVQRGRYGTAAVAHAAGDYDDTEVFDENIVVEGREVTLYELDHSLPNETELWHGQLEQPDLSEGVSAVDLVARDAFALVANKTFGEGRLEWDGTILNGVAAGMPSGCVVHPANPWASARGPGILPARDADDNQRIIVWHGETLVAGQVAEGSIGGLPAWRIYSAGAATGDNWGGYDPLFGTPAGVDRIDEDGVIREVLIADADSPYSLFKDENGDPSDHPLDALLCIMTGSGGAYWFGGGSHTKGANGDWDWLPGVWGLNIPVAWIDTAAIVALRDSLPLRGLRARNLVLGATEELPKAPEVLRRLLQPLSAFLTMNASGQITVLLLDDPGPSGVVATLTTDDLYDVIQEQPYTGPWGKRGRVKMKACRAGVSGDYKAHIWDTEITGRLQNRFPWGVDDLEIDAGDYGSPSEHFLDSTTYDLLRALALRRFYLLRDRLPFYVARFMPSTPNIAFGAIVSFSNRVVVGENGERSISGHRCLVVGGQREPETRVLTLHLLDLYPLTRASKTVAPSWRVKTVTSSTQFTIAADEFSADDRALFDASKSYELFNAAAGRRSAIAQTVSVYVQATGAVTLTGAWTSGGAITPAVGDVVRLPAYDLRGTWDRAYVADTSATLGAANDAAHRWGM